MRQLKVDVTKRRRRYKEKWKRRCTAILNTDIALKMVNQAQLIILGEV